MNFVFRFLSIIFCFILVAHISGCSQGRENNSSSTANGSAVFSIIWPEDAPTQRVAKALGHPTIDCTGISAIKVDVYEDPAIRYLASDSFDCSLGEGKIYNIPVGLNRRVVVSAIGDANTILYQGEKGNITIVKNEITDVGFITLNTVEPDNEAPLARIIQPLGGTFYYGEKITFEGSGEDAEDGLLFGSHLIWESDIDSQIGQGTRFFINDLSIGVHVITLRVTDNDGDFDTATTQISVSELPVAKILQPVGGTFPYGEEIIFEGSGVDTEDGQLTGSHLQWESDIDGSIGEGIQFVKSNLSSGNHMITLKVIDSNGGAGTATTHIFLNKLPLANITKPLGETLVYGEEITFEGSGVDAEDGLLSGSHLQWESDIDGSIGEGVQFAIDDLSAGVHTITLRITDNDGGMDTATTRITIWSQKNSIGMNFNLIPTGTFTMGSPEDEPGRFSDEVQHEVTLTRSFYIQTTEVTQGQWEAVMGEGTNNSYYKCGDDCPVQQVTWYDCVIFSNRLSQKEGLTPSYYADRAFSTVFDGNPPVTSGYVYWNQDANGYRLPTEAEWEYAARAGSKTAFANGDITFYEGIETTCNYDPNLDAMAWYCDNNGISGIPQYGPKLVAQKNANAWGLFDMHGNVGEWCQDWYNEYPAYDIKDPSGPSSGSYRVSRGGFWNLVASNCRAACRLKKLPSLPYDYVGFRVVFPLGH